MTDEIIAFHEAGHAVVGWYFGMMPTHVTLEPHVDGNPATTSDRTEYREHLPGDGLLRNLVDSCVTVVESASGACAELKVGVEHEKCGWSGDFRKFDEHLKAISKICGHSYEYCWDLASAMSKEILGDPKVWEMVEQLAAKLLQKRSLSADDLQAFFMGRTQPEQRDNYLRILFEFVNTPRARWAARESESRSG